MKSKYDRSTKPFEVLVKLYQFSKSTRKICNNPKWKHLAYYNTMQSCNDAIRDFRKVYKYEDIFKICRFKAVDRNESLFNGWGEYL